MRSKWMEHLFMIALIATIVIAGFGQAVLQLWNLLMPDIFGLHRITFWQAVGLIGLSWILFGGLGMFRGRPRRSWRSRVGERLRHMSPEERKRFLDAMEHRCRPERSRQTRQAPETGA
jgi:Ca2+/H+ antiporter, TMEM165/GDT1 family